MTLDQTAQILSYVAAATSAASLIAYFRRTSDEDRPKSTRYVLGIGAFGAFIAIAANVLTSLGSGSDMKVSLNCKQSSDFAPTDISCVGQSDESTSVEWLYQGEVAARDKSTFQRRIDSAGSYSIRYLASQRGLLGTKTAHADHQLVIKERPSEPAIKIRRMAFSQNAERPSTTQEQFSVASGYRIKDVSIQVESSNNASYSIQRNDNSVTLAFNLTPKPRFIGFQLGWDRAWISGVLVLTEEQLR
jgi:hypothetical protein